MVDFNLAPAERRKIQELSAFLDAEVQPLQEKYLPLATHEARVIGEDGLLRPDLMEMAKELRRRSAKAGFYAMHLPEEVGGLGMSATGMLQANKEVFRRGMGFTFAVIASIEGPGRMLLSLNEDQRRRWLAPMVRGEKTSCFALTEPGAGSDVRSIQTTATLDGDHWVLNGTKVFITNGPYADFAQVFAKTGPDEISAFIVDRGTPGFTIGEGMETIANNGLPCELRFENCRVPQENLIGDTGLGFYLALQNINDIRIQIGGMSLGLAQFCLDRTVDYVKGRTAFGKPISKYQGVSFPLADCATELKAAEMLAMYTAWLIDQGESPIQETSMTKLYTTEMLWNVADRCIGAHGGVGVLRATQLERILRWARVMRIFEGTNEIQRQTIAKTMGL
ncbi:MAG TPA: acyl-CoA dehydrogenase family protein [Candidatus Thermoplasmatota archaeon]|nr:acyl-CoA dehydrogenase family protein [Candidatus Thermoplasmatota archaeon]